MGTRAVVQWQLEHRTRPEQLPRVPRLAESAQTYGEERFEAACRRSLPIGPPHRKRIIEILKLFCSEGFYWTGDSVAPAARINRFHGVVEGRLRREVVEVHAEHRR
jgi:hypothetical protein